MVNKNSLSVSVIDENRIRVATIEVGLRQAEHNNVTLVHGIDSVMHKIEHAELDVIVIDLKNPNRDCMEHMLQLSRSVFWIQPMNKVEE